MARCLHLLWKKRSRGSALDRLDPTGSMLAYRRRSIRNAPAIFRFTLSRDVLAM